VKNKVVKITIIIIILFFPLKWFLFTPIYNSFLLSKIEKLNKEEFVRMVNDIKECEIRDDIYGRIYCQNQYDTINAKAGVSFSTKNSQYYFVEKGNEPIWKSCLYKVSGSSKKLLPLPKNCNYFTWFHTGTSKNSENLVIYQDGYNTYQYIINDSGKIYRYLKSNPEK
jgi:hypothetical protein